MTRAVPRLPSGPAPSVAVAGLPGDLGEGVHVRLQVLVALGDAGEALDRAAVEPRPVLDRIGQLVERDGDALDGADDVGELELDEADVVLLGRFDLLQMRSSRPAP
jgi:hypothetical protein